MWKCSAIVVLLFFTGAKTIYRHDEEVIETFMKNKCLKNGKPNAFEEVKEGARQFSNCVKDEFFTPKTTDKSVQRFCTKLYPEFYSCLDIFLYKIEPCLDSEEKYIPEFITSWLNATVEKHCGDDGETITVHLEELEFIAKYRKCNSIQSINSILENCFSKSTILKDLEDPDFVVRKSGLCSYFEHGNKCLIDLVKGHCGEELGGFVEEHLNPTKVWCDKYVNNNDTNNQN